jgi:hypothetical protein
MINLAIFCSISASLLTFIITKNLYDNKSHIYRLEEQLYKANIQLDDYKRDDVRRKNDKYVNAAFMALSVLCPLIFLLKVIYDRLF